MFSVPKPQVAVLLAYIQNQFFRGFNVPCRPSNIKPSLPMKSEKRLSASTFLIFSFLDPSQALPPLSFLYPKEKDWKKCFLLARASASPAIIYEQNGKGANCFVKSTIAAGPCWIWTCWLCPTSPQYLRQPGWLTAPRLILQLVSGNGKLRKAQPFLDENNLLDSQIAELVVTPGPEILQRIGVRSEPAATTRTRCVNNTQLHSRVKSQGVFIIINVKVCK